MDIKSNAGARGGSGASLNSSRSILALVLAAIHSGLGMLLAALALGPISLGHAQEYSFTTLAGPADSPGAVDGMGTTARFNLPYGTAVDSAGNAYVADTFNNTIRKVTPTGV